MEFIFIIGIAIFLFFICRELVCWYWKINIMVEQNARVLERLDYIARKVGFKPTTESADENRNTASATADFKWKDIGKGRLAIVIIAIIVVIAFLVLLKVNPYLTSMDRYMFPHILD